MTPQTGVFPRIHTSYNIYELLIHEMTHDTANEGDPGLVPRSAPTRRRSGAALGTSPKQTSAARGAVRDGHATSWSGGGTSWDGVSGARAPPRERRPHPRRPTGSRAHPARPHRHQTSAATGRGIRDRSPAPARRAVVIGLQPAVNGRGYGLYV